jgi:hypothetical protein
MRNLAREYDLSDVSLAKVCEAYDIPRPPVGYWAKKEHGKAPSPPPLPACDDAELQRITLPVRPPDAPPNPPPPPPRYDADVAELLERARALQPVIVASTLRNLHPLVQATKEAYHDQKPDTNNLVTPRWNSQPEPLSIRVGNDSITRALLFFDALIKAVERIGGKVVVEKVRWSRETIVYFAGEKVATLRLRERYKQQPHKPDPKDSWDRWKKIDCIPTGRLLLEDGPSAYGKPYCADTEKRNRIEDAINGLLISFVESAGRIRIRRRDEAEAQKRREEVERIRREREAELRRRREELQKRQQAEQARVDQLLAEADGWRSSRVLRAYIRTVESTVRRRDGMIEDGSELDQWLTWARCQADRLDPLVESPPSILDETIS